ncbi:MAG: hypothetical protein A7316_06135 [Candidatus Altiarchaeales archaeon WOR_SM1_86-2]|nr:MAG: hypothetical protein A7316_06135 [Candidatus Altiarchaeales archaeon WOR_SM1_86-2]ODS41380.1 MAG: hypothetical protein A7315_06495 [Candidatus Altiarchaeales archaeon WOR_SM1_79]
MIGYLDGLWFIIPAYIATASAVLFGRILPICLVDLNRNFFDGRRIFGAGKTIGGFCGGLITGALVGLLQSYIDPGLFGFVMSIELAFIIASGAMIGDLVGSFIKRRAGIEQGGDVPLLDQLDFVVGALAFGYLAGIELSLIGIILVLIMTPVLHRVTNFIAFKLKLKDVWW